MSNATPWIDPELVAMGEAMKQRGLASLSPATSPLPECRAMLDRIGVFLNEQSLPLARERNLSITGPHGMIPCRLYLPDGIKQPPVMVYAHGGSFALGTLNAWDTMLRELVRQSGVAIVSVAYRLAPEHRFPIGFDEVFATIRYVAVEGASLGLDPKCMAAGGDSAGANLALSAALALRDTGRSPLSFLLLVYGVYAATGNTDSWERFGTGTYGLSSAQLRWVWEHYLASPADANDWRVAPLSASMHDLPRVHSLVGTLDPLRDDSSALACRLAEAGVANELKLYEGLTHGFIRYGQFIGTARRAVSDCAAVLAKALMQGR
ncbi:MAG: alpha/beta hydrolase [Betaproteobacteria bacterium]|nr:alpha/beta hydrolase [Betaproteobacteria bacterium]